MQVKLPCFYNREGQEDRKCWYVGGFVAGASVVLNGNLLVLITEGHLGRKKCNIEKKKRCSQFDNSKTYFKGSRVMLVLECKSAGLFFKLAAFKA